MSSVKRAICVATVAALINVDAVADVSRPCPPDLTCSGDVGTADLLHLLSAWGPCQDCPEDLTGSGNVGTADLIELLSHWGPCLFEYWDQIDHPEAFQISLEKLGPAGELLPSEETYERVVQDLAAIRDEIPELKDVIHVDAWVPDSLIVDIEPDALPTLDCLQAFYQGEVVNVLFDTMHVMDYEGMFNAEAMAEIYGAVTEVNWAEPNGIIGGDNIWEPTDLGDGTWEWVVYDGFHDCFDGCDCFRIYTIHTTEDDDVTLIDYEETGMPWCEF